MRWYKRLFWKIFSAIWLVSVLVLLATVLVIGAVTEKKRFNEVVMAKAEGYAELMVERYERRGRRPMLPRLKQRPPKHEHFGLPREHRDEFRKYQESRYGSKAWKRSLWLNIADRVWITDIEYKRKVAGPRFLRPDSDSLFTYTLNSSQGHEYRVEVDLNWEHSPFGHMISTMLSVQMVLIVFVSGLGALVVSAIIVRPLNRLREHTQAIYQGELDSRTDEKLRSRGDELGDLAREFDRMADYVQQTLTSHQRLMQDVSHELRAPLARLQAATGLAEQRLGEDDKVVQRISRECKRLDQLIAEILSLSKLEQMERPGEVTDLGNLLQELVDDAGFAYPKRQFNLQLQGTCTIALNPKLLERALNNILGNACKHTPEDSPVDVMLDSDKQCTITIRDYGQGVSEESLARLCEPFYRAASQSEGYGLGLSIAHRAVQRLGGELVIRNHAQQGLVVTLTLPKC